MQLDKTRIEIRERSYVDLLDLALYVIRAHAWPLAISSSLGAIPMIAFNIWLLGGDSQALNGWLELFRAPTEAMLDGDVGSTDWGFGTFFYGYWVSCLIVLQTPLASAPTTIYLGMALFEEKPSFARVVLELKRALPQLLLYQVLMRGLLTPFVISWLVLYGAWPYLNEVILLERNPVRRKSAQGRTTLARNSDLHGSAGGDLFGRWILAGIVGAFWFICLMATIFYLRRVLANQTEFDWFYLVVVVQFAIWIVLSFFTVARFLSYLDLRIRSEGWEVELRMRAEAARLSRTWI